MKINNRPIYQFTVEDLNDYFMYSLKKPTIGRLHSIDDGRMLSKFSSDILLTDITNKDNTVISKLVPNITTERRFSWIPREVTIVNGTYDKLTKLYYKCCEELSNNNHLLPSQRTYCLCVWKDPNHNSATLLFCSPINEIDLCSKLAESNQLPYFRHGSNDVLSWQQSLPPYVSAISNDFSKTY